MLSVFFFEPVGSCALWHAVDLIKIELYALVATCSVIAFAHLGNMVIAAWANTESLKRLNESKSILLRELAHSVANNLVALIVNELVTNAIKHAFPNGRSGCIRVRFEALENNQLQLRVEDDGIGIVVHHPQRNGGLGQELVKGLAHELGGHLEVKTSERGGSTFILCMLYVGPVQSAAPSASTLTH